MRDGHNRGQQADEGAARWFRLLPSQRPGVRSLHRWFIPVALLALAPKCVLCLLAYTGLGVALGFGGPELCGAPAESPQPKIEARLLHGYLDRF